MGAEGREGRTSNLLVAGPVASAEAVVGGTAVVAVLDPGLLVPGGVAVEHDEVHAVVAAVAVPVEVDVAVDLDDVVLVGPERTDVRSADLVVVEAVEVGVRVHLVLLVAHPDVVRRGDVGARGVPRVEIDVDDIDLPVAQADGHELVDVRVRVAVRVAVGVGVGVGVAVRVAVGVGVGIAVGVRVGVAVGVGVRVGVGLGGAAGVIALAVGAGAVALVAGHEGGEDEREEGAGHGDSWC